MDWADSMCCKNCGHYPGELVLQLATLQTRAEKAEARIAELERERDEARAALDRTNELFSDHDSRISVERVPEGYWRYSVKGASSGPFRSYREAYRAAEGFLDYQEIVRRAETAEKERDEWKARADDRDGLLRAFNKMRDERDAWRARLPAGMLSNQPVTCKDCGRPITRFRPANGVWLACCDHCTKQAPVGADESQVEAE